MSRSLSTRFSSLLPLGVMILASFMAGCASSTAPITTSSDHASFTLTAAKAKPTPDPCQQYYGKGYCVDYPGLLHKFSGNAGTWHDKAISAGKSVGTTPKVDATAVYGIFGVGHVAKVTSVTKDAKGNVTSYKVKHWNYGAKMINVACSVTDLFGKETETTVKLDSTLHKSLKGFIYK